MPSQGALARNFQATSTRNFLGDVPQLVHGNLKAMTIDARLDRLTGIVESLAASVVEHNDQIKRLINPAEKHPEEMAELPRSPQ
jgi:hypothetical protein